MQDFKKKNVGFFLKKKLRFHISGRVWQDVKSDDFTSVESLAGCKKSNLSQKNK
jgi:hypothetical protein